METILGPIRKEKLILCSADASPDAQRNEPGPAAYFFPNAAWVGAVRNSAERLGCKFVILTTGYGLVEPDDLTVHSTHISMITRMKCAIGGRRRYQGCCERSKTA